MVFTYLHNEARAEEGTKAVEAKRAALPCPQADAADYHATEEAVKRTLDEFGQIDILVNNDGGYSSILPHPCKMNGCG